MIRKTFLFLPGIQSKKEKNIRDQGICNWNAFLDAKQIKGISAKRKIFYDNIILKAKKALYEEDMLWFKQHWPTTETWRLYEHFKEECCYVDIEGNITLIGIFDGYETKTMINNINFDKRLLKKELSKYKLIITYNGSAYDLPKLNKYYDFLPDIPHIDLKHVCRRVGLVGGLKEIEKKLSIERPYHLYGSAADCYRAFLASGRKEYLEGLVEYNEEDTINLKPITGYCYSILSAKNK